ncbi:hypothetical protein BU15DRAFT_69180 [Melanogaster broomeanus]|nr:hypothetical protein BU15DRAFT_69180 [Melanogaster broomeanus]
MFALELMTKGTAATWANEKSRAIRNGPYPGSYKASKMGSFTLFRPNDSETLSAIMVVLGVNNTLGSTFPHFCSLGAVQSKYYTHSLQATMPRDSRKVRFASEGEYQLSTNLPFKLARKAMLYNLPPVNEVTPVPSLAKRSWRIYEARLNQESSGEESRVEPHAAEALYPPISQLVIPAQPEPSKKNNSKATGPQAHLGRLVIPSAPKTAGNWVIRPLSQHLSAKIVIPSGPKQARRTSATHRNISTLILPSEPKPSNNKIDSVQSAPGPSNSLLSEAENIALDTMDVDAIPSQINPSDFQQMLRSPSYQAMYRHILESQICMPDVRGIAHERPHLQQDSFMEPVAENFFTDTLAARIWHQDTPELRKIGYNQGLDYPLKRAMEDYQWSLLVALKCRRSVVERQRRLLDELQILQMERKKYAITLFPMNGIAVYALPF